MLHNQDILIVRGQNLTSLNPFKLEDDHNIIVFVNSFIITMTINPSLTLKMPNEN